MQHTDPDELAMIALGEPPEDPATAVHLGQCPQCRDEVESLRRTVDLARETVGHRDEVRPPEPVWDRIAAELDLPAGDTARRTGDEQAAPPAPRRPDLIGPAAPTGGGAAADEVAAARLRRADEGAPEAPTDATAVVSGGAGAAAPDGSAGERGPVDLAGARRRRRLRGVAALVAAAAVGVVGTLVAVRPWDDGSPAGGTAASAQLAPVAGGPGRASGRVVVVRGASGPELQVTAAGLPAASGYYEVWVFDGERDMVSVGVLGGDSAATLPLPPTLDLRRFRVVDVSQEQYDGDQTHSTVSVLRGTLTD